MNDFIEISSGDYRTIDEIMPVMEASFDPAFGEAWTAGQCFGMLTIPGSGLLIARHDDIVVGFALFRSILEEAELLLIATRPDTRRKGVGYTLTRSVIDLVSRKGAKMLFLEVREGNPALALYFNVGFLQVGSREKYYRGKAGEYFNALTMRYEIAP